MAKVRSAYGTGTVYLQGDSYVSQLLYTVEIEGKSYSKRISGSGKTANAAVRKRNKNAQKWEQKLREEFEANKGQEEEPKKSQGLTVNDVFLANLSLKDASIQLPTSENYETYYIGYVQNSPLGEMQISEVTEEILLNYYKETRLNGRKRFRKDSEGNPINKKPLGINTINHIRFVLANTFQYAFEKGIIEKNPHINIPPFKAGTAAMVNDEQEDLDGDSDDSDALEKVIPLEDLTKILEYAFKHSRLAGLFAWAVNSGMRQGECLGLKRDYAAPDSSYIFVKKSLTFVKNRKETGPRTLPRLKKPKNGKERKVPYNQPLKEIYEFQLRQIEREKEEAGVMYHDRGLLFSDEYGDYLRPWKVLKEFHRILDAVGVEQHRFHDLRHTFVSLLVRESQKCGEGISVLEVSAIVGHSDPTVTMKVYGGLFPNATEKAMKILDRCDAIYIPVKRDGEQKQGA